MRPNLCLAVVFATAAVGLSSSSFAQSILERLEKRLGDAGVQLPAQVPNRVERLAPAPAPAAQGGYLGLTADTKEGHVEIISVRAGGPADVAGIKPGDRVVSVGGVEAVSLDDFGAIISKVPAGSQIDLVVSRAGREQKIRVTVAERAPRSGEELPLPPEAELPEERPLAQQRATLGIRALPVSTELQRRYGLVVRRGAVIDNVAPGSPAERYGLPVGAAITAVDGARVDSPDDLAEIIGAAQPGDTIEVSYYQRDQVFRKKVRLVPADSGVAVPTPGEDRPLLRRLERALGDAAPADQGALAAMQAQVQALQNKIDALEDRLQQLESRLPPMPAEEKPSTKESDDGPTLKPLEP